MQVSVFDSHFHLHSNSKNARSFVQKQTNETKAIDRLINNKRINALLIVYSL